MTGLGLPRPSKILYLITNRCNCRCKMCHFWKKKDDESLYISETRVKEIIDEMADLRMTELAITGGEPLLFKGKLLGIIKYANEKGLYTHFGTNGILLDKEFLENFNDAGGGHISLSIDGLEEIHDDLRGRPGTFKAALKALCLIREGRYKNIVLKINFLLTNNNLDDLEKVVMLAVAHDALIFVQPYAIYDNNAEKLFSLWITEKNQVKLKKAIDCLRNLKRRYPSLVLNDEKYINGMYDYFLRVKSKKGRCSSGIHQIVMQPDGKVVVCKFGTVADLKSGSLKDCISSRKRAHISAAVVKCSDNCMQGCFFRQSVFELLTNGIGQFIKLISVRRD
ncbi:MAG: radical SAM protein [Candidatus Omnitrophica bacterium]|nr:radical SAM protein [Candidatus Omnitrophota bacterium]